MEKYFEILSQCPLFIGITKQEMSEMLGCLNGKIVEIAKGSPLFLEGEPARFVGVVLSGAVQIVRDDYFGNRSVLTVVPPGGLFGEAFACAGLETLPVSAICTPETQNLQGSVVFQATSHPVVHNSCKTPWNQYRLHYPAKQSSVILRSNQMHIYRST